MIKNIIFDIGNVLISFQPLEYLNPHYNKETVQDLMNYIFHSPEWIQLDLGTILIKDAIASLTHQHPEYTEEITYVLNHWTEMLLPIKENISLLYPLKEAGYQLYLLSNFHIEAIDIMFKQYDFFNLFDGGIISGHIHHIKPDPVIYQELLQNYHLKAEECLFIDDSYDNIVEALNQHIHTIHLTNDISLADELQKQSIL